MEEPFILHFQGQENALADPLDLGVKATYDISFAEKESFSFKDIHLLKHYYRGALSYLSMIRWKAMEPVDCIVQVAASVVGFFYVVDGEINCEMAEMPERFFVAGGRTFIMYTAAGQYTLTLSKGNATVVYVVLHRDLLRSMASDYPELSAPIRKLIDGDTSTELYHLMDISTAMKLQLRKLGRFKPMKSLGTESAILSMLNELMESQLQQLQQKQYSVAGSREIAFRVYEHVRIQAFIGPLDRIEKIAGRHNIGYDTLLRVFKQTFGLTLGEFIVQQKMDAAKYLLVKDGLSVTAVSERLGYADVFTFSRLFKVYYGYPPSEEKRR